MKKHILLCAALALSSFGLPSCSDILDQKPLDSYTDTAVWGDLSLAESFLNYCYLRVEAENLKSATKPLNVLIAFTRPLITEFADNLNLKHPLLPTISPYPTM